MSIIDVGRHLARAIVIVGLISQYSCSLCNEQIRQQVRSPDGDTTATYYVRDCGATTNFANLVNLRPSSKKFDGDDAAGVVMDVQGRQDIELRWQDNHSLVVHCPTCKAVDVLNKINRWKQIAIIYADGGTSGTLKPRPDPYKAPIAGPELGHVFSDLCGPQANKISSDSGNLDASNTKLVKDNCFK